MANHHPPRACFEILAWTDATLTVRGTFTEKRKTLPRDEIWDFTADNSADYFAFKATPTGVFFNANVRGGSTWSALRVS